MPHEVRLSHKSSHVRLTHRNRRTCQSATTDHQGDEQPRGGVQRDRGTPQEEAEGRSFLPGRGCGHAIYTRRAWAQEAAPGGRDVWEAMSCRVVQTKARTCPTGSPWREEKLESGDLWVVARPQSTLSGVLQPGSPPPPPRDDRRREKTEHVGGLVSTKPPECGRLGGSRDATDDHGRLWGCLVDPAHE